MNHKQSLLGVGKFYTAEEALAVLRNTSDFEDESTPESEIEGDSSDSSEYTPEQQYQVRTDSNIQTLLPKETVNQNATKCALLCYIRQCTHMCIFALDFFICKLSNVPSMSRVLHYNSLYALSLHKPCSFFRFPVLHVLVRIKRISTY